MSLFIVDITKRFDPNGQEWGNRYIVRADTLADAGSGGNLIVDHEAAIHGTDVTIVKRRVATLTANDGIYNTLPLNVPGTFGPASEAIVPIQTCMRVDVATEGNGRPSRKFYHLCWGFETIDDVQVWDATFTAAVDTEIGELLTDMISNGTPLVDADDQGWLVVTAFQKFAYHQFHKQSARPAP